MVRSAKLVQWLVAQCVCLCLGMGGALGQDGTVTGSVKDETGGALPGVDVRTSSTPVLSTTTDSDGRFALQGLPRGIVQLVFSLPNFAAVRRDVNVGSMGQPPLDVTLRFVLSADVTVTGTTPFTNLADVEDPAANLVGTAQSASQGAITARQLEARPLLRSGEVLETVPGVIVSQHSGEGKANQYYLRGFNLDHGTDFATTVAGMPANMPTHAHGHGYTDLNFLIPELIGGVQYSKGPYFADQGDFATAGAANINYVSALPRSIVRVTGGGFAYGRALAAASLTRADATWLGAVEVEHNDGPWTLRGDFRKSNVVGRYSRGNAASGFSVTGMFYRARWNATDQVPSRAVAAGTLGRFGSIDASNGGATDRASASVEWQRTRGRGVTRIAAYGIRYSLDLFSNFTYFLEDPVNGDQFKQADRRTVLGGRIVHRRLATWNGRSVQNSVGAQLRSDDIGLNLTHTARRAFLHPVRQDDVVQTSGALHAQNEISWSPWLRSLAGIRVDGYRFNVAGITDPRNSGVDRAGIVSPKAGVVVGPFRATEFYGNAGMGFHSNDARGSTIRVDPVTGEPARRVTPLARATGAEFGIRTVAIPRLQSSLSIWSLRLASELIFAGDAGTTEAGRPSHRYGVEFANYYRPTRWLTLDADVAWSIARFTDDSPAGRDIPGAVRTVGAGGVTLDGTSRLYGGLRLRYFGARPLVEDGSARSRATTLANLEAGYKLSPRLRLSADLLNAFDARASDIDYFYTSRLPFEPAGGVSDTHFHPVIPRVFRVAVTAQF
jgi:outer membrane receptor protein involved in Fe transport